MYSCLVVFFVCAVCIAFGHCNTIYLQPGNSYAWIIPPQLQQQPTFAGPPQSDLKPDLQRQSRPPPAGGCGHPILNRQYSQEQLRLPNDYLVAPSDPYRPPSPTTFQNPVNCEGGDCIQHPSNFAPVQAMPEQRSAPPPPVNWPGGHGGGVGLLFFVPPSASHIPVEQLIHQHLVLHQAQLPFDISMNCGDSSSGCARGIAGAEAKPPTAATTFNGDHVENVNYASLPLVKNVNSSNQLVQHGWGNIGELLAQQQQIQHQRQLSILPI